jgi:uroporphyrinogen III methyltransferase/synthase
MLAKSGGIVEQVVVYESVDVARADGSIVTAMAGGKIDWTTVTSSAIARSLVRLFGESLRKTKLVAISPLTAETLGELGFSPAVTADDYNAAGIAEAIRGWSPTR